MNGAIIKGLFGLLFNLATAALAASVLLLIGAMLGSVEMVWIGRIGILLQILGISLFVLEFAGVAQEGQSPLRWWLHKLISQDSDLSRPDLWPRQMLLIVGVGALIMGLLLQLLSSWG